MKLSDSFFILKSAIEKFRPTHIVSMVSGGKDSAVCDAVARELGAKIDFVLHGNTRCGIPETSKFVRDTYSKIGDYIEADAGTSYEDYVLRKGFFGKGISAHSYAYNVLKATPFRKALSANIRKGKRDIRILLLNGARKDESENRKKHLQLWRSDPAQKNNIWVNLIFNWTKEDEGEYIKSRSLIINPVALKLCRSGECMCGTMQSKEERYEASIIYPEWGKWLNELEDEVKEKHGFGWGENFSQKRNKCQLDLFQPMCKDCLNPSSLPLIAVLSSGNPLPA